MVVSSLTAAKKRAGKIRSNLHTGQYAGSISPGHSQGQTLVEPVLRSFHHVLRSFVFRFLFIMLIWSPTVVSQHLKSDKRGWLTRWPPGSFANPIWHSARHYLHRSDIMPLCFHLLWFSLMVGLLHAMAFMVLLLIGWVIWNNKPLPFTAQLTCFLFHIFGETDYKHM